MNQFEIDFLKPEADIFKPDKRCLYFANSKDAFEAHYALISTILLNKHVYKDVKVQFETAKNAFVYSFFSYRLAMMAVHQSIAATEFALRRMIGNPNTKRKETFKPLLQKAHDLGLIDASKIRSHLDIDKLKSLLGNFRNDLSHGSHTLMPPHLMAPLIEYCGSIINQLFENMHAKDLKPSWNAWQ